MDQGGTGVDAGPGLEVVRVDGSGGRPRVSVPDSPSDRLKPYVPRLLVDSTAYGPERTYQERDGPLVFVDISGFTKLTARVPRHGKVGAEETAGLSNAAGGAL